ncbi:MAG: exopolysaccharide biosynthesis polyprenyl glycosylphosphotransferase [Opitutaceae bacterium]|jgi:exopolysaccharide biosynthesis polyprenyl glycosylphosphotransferase|nr:exopolysaccharide biosynthesis polyprenyl glycosylphosphotransferase [Opitutaceae bacterium]
MMTPRKTAALLLALDALCVLVCFNAAAWARGIASPGHWITWPLLGPLAFLASGVYLIDGYRDRTDMLSLDFASQHLIAMVGATLATLLLTFAVIPANYPLQGSRAVTLLGFGACLPLTLAYRRSLYLRRIRHQERHHLLFIGDRVSSEAFHGECLRNGFNRPVLYADASGAPATEGHADMERRTFREVLAEIETSRLSVEAIVLRESGRELPGDISQPLVELYFKGVPTYTLELFHQVYWRKIPLYRLNQTWLFQEGFKIAREPVFERLKRATDIACAVSGLVLAAPVLLAAALAVRLEDGGPALFRQRRIGRNRHPFTVVKLRSMRAPGPAQTPAPGVDPARITRVGRFLRATRIDELPQLWNVLRGEMSLIGPRAEWEDLVRHYEQEIPCYHFRHLVRPGITGWAQVNYPYGATLENTLRKLEFDLYYIRHFSFLLDASIVLKTIHTMLVGKGK